MATLQTHHRTAEAQTSGRRDVAPGAASAPAGAAGLAGYTGHTGRARHAGRKAVLDAMLAFNHLLMARLAGATASEWLHVGLSSGQIKLLFWLASAGEQQMNHVARALGVSTPAATSLVDKLVEHGLATREHSPTDRRVVLVRATDEGQALAARLRQISDEQWRRILDHVPDESLPALGEGIGALTLALRQVAAEQFEAACSLSDVHGARESRAADPSASSGQAFELRTFPEGAGA